MKIISKIILPVIALAVGVIIGYLVCKNTLKKENDKSLANAELKAAENTTVNAAPANTNKSLLQSSQSALTEIPLSDAEIMRDGYRNDPSVLFGTNGAPLKGFYVDRASLDKILSAGDCTGVSFYMAKHKDYLNTSKRVYTLVFMGAQKASPTATTYKDITTHVYDHVDICPDVCGIF